MTDCQRFFGNLLSFLTIYLGSNEKQLVAEWDGGSPYGRIKKKLDLLGKIERVELFLAEGGACSTVLASGGLVLQ